MFRPNIKNKNVFEDDDSNIDPSIEYESDSEQDLDSEQELNKILSRNSSWAQPPVKVQFQHLDSKLFLDKGDSIYAPTKEYKEPPTKKHQSEVASTYTKTVNGVPVTMAILKNGKHVAMEEKKKIEKIEIPIIDNNLTVENINSVIMDGNMSIDIKIKELKARLKDFKTANRPIRLDTKKGSANIKGDTRSEQQDWNSLIEVHPGNMNPNQRARYEKYRPIMTNIGNFEKGQELFHKTIRRLEQLLAVGNPNAPAPLVTLEDHTAPVVSKKFLNENDNFFKKLFIEIGKVLRNKALITSVPSLHFNTYNTFNILLTAENEDTHARGIILDIKNKNVTPIFSTILFEIIGFCGEDYILKTITILDNLIRILCSNPKLYSIRIMSTKSDRLILSNIYITFTEPQQNTIINGSTTFDELVKETIVPIPKKPSIMTLSCKRFILESQTDSIPGKKPKVGIIEEIVEDNDSQLISDTSVNLPIFPSSNKAIRVESKPGHQVATKNKFTGKFDKETDVALTSITPKETPLTPKEKEKIIVLTPEEKIAEQERLEKLKPLTPEEQKAELERFKKERPLTPGEQKLFSAIRKKELQDKIALKNSNRNRKGRPPRPPKNPKTSESSEGSKEDSSEEDESNGTGLGIWA